MYINVYDILALKVNNYLACGGLGIFHTGVEVNGSEYAYGGNALMESTGVYEMEPMKHSAFRFRQQIVAGRVEDMDRVYRVLGRLMRRYRANAYDMLLFNCNHFCDELLRELLGRGLPGHLNRAAKVGGVMACIVPKRYRIVVPPGTTEEDIQLKCLGKTWDVVDGSKSVRSTTLQDETCLTDNSDEGSDGQVSIPSDIEDESDRVNTTPGKQEEDSELIIQPGGEMGK